MTRQTYALVALVMTCLALLSTAVWWNSGSARKYQQDLEYYSRKCEAERQSKEGDYKKDCQSILYRTIDDPIAILTGGLVLATIALFAVTYLLYAAAARQGADAKEALIAARDSAKASQISASAAEKSVALERPWMIAPTVEVQRIDEINGRKQVHLLVVSKNIGKTPTIGIALEVDIVRHVDWQGALNRLRSMEMAAFGAVEDLMFSAVPGGEFPAPRTVDCPPDVLSGAFGAQIVGAITYRSEADGEPRQTGFVAPIYTDKTPPIAPHVYGVLPT